MTRLSFSLLLAATLATVGCNKPKPAASTQPEAAATPGAPTGAPASGDVAAAPAGENNGPGGRGPGQGGGQRRTPAERVEQMKTSLGLSDDQAQKITAVFEAQRPAMEALRNDQSLSRDQRREKMEAMRQTMDQQLSSILTPEQKAKWDEERAKMRERFANRQGGGQGGRRGGGENAPQQPAPSPGN